LSLLCISLYLPALPKPPRARVIFLDYRLLYSIFDIEAAPTENMMLHAMLVCSNTAILLYYCIIDIIIIAINIF
jgi:hypothetical protein